MPADLTRQRMFRHVIFGLRNLQVLIGGRRGEREGFERSPRIDLRPMHRPWNKCERSLRREPDEFPDGEECRITLCVKASLLRHFSRTFDAKEPGFRSADLAGFFHARHDGQNLIGGRQMTGERCTLRFEGCVVQPRTTQFDAYLPLIASNAGERGSMFSAGFFLEGGQVTADGDREAHR